MNKTSEALKLLYLLIALSTLTSCGTLFIPKHKREAMIESNVNATVYEGDYKLGKTPYRVTTKNKSSIEYTLKANGYREANVFAIPSYDNKLEMLDVLGFGIPLYVDGITSGLKYFKEKSIFVNLYKKYDKKEARVIVKEVSYQFRENEHLGKLNNKVKFNRNKFQYFEIMNSILENENNSRLDVVNFKKNNLNSDYIAKGKYILQPEISELKFSKNKARVECSAIINWNLTRNDTTIFENKRKYDYFSNGKNKIEVYIIGLVTKSWYSIQENDSLIEILKTNFNIIDDKIKDTLEITNGEIKLEEKKNLRLSNATKAVVTIKSEEGFGSGFFISEDGYLISNAHVVGKEKTLEVILHSGKKLMAEVVRINEEADLCLLKIEDEKIKHWLPIPKKLNINVGDDVYAIGTPENIKLSQTLTRGIISAMRKDDDGKEIIQSDVSINSGNSGGPLLNENAEVIGINTSKIKKEGVQGISFSIPINNITKYLLIKTK